MLPTFINDVMHLGGGCFVTLGIIVWVKKHFCVKEGKEGERGSNLCDINYEWSLSNVFHKN